MSRVKKKPGMMKKHLIGSLRISVTPSCNLDCVYCHKEGYNETIRKERMSPDEIARVVRIATGLGVRKIKITGGEPLLRNDIATIIENISKIDKIAVLSFTTNGVLLHDFLERNPGLGIDRINVSLDSLKRGVYESIVGKDRLFDVIAGINKAVCDGIQVELNTLVLKDLTAGEVSDITAFANRNDTNVQFIELVKTDGNQEFYGKHFYPLEKVEEFLENKADFVEAGAKKYDRKVFHVGNSQIVTCKVVRDPRECSSLRCKLLRVTADGRIKFFMINDDRYILDLLGPMRDGAGDAEIKEIFIKAARLSEELNERRFD
jgi:GTP 3',8-cyclase